MKKCSKCGEDKPDSDFYPDKRNRTGLMSACRKCGLSSMKAFRKKRRSNPHMWAVDALYGVKYRCKRDGVIFAISPLDIVIPEVCPIRLVPFVFGEVNHPDSPSIDRIKPELGYIQGNVAVISHKANMMKSDCTDPAVFRRLADWMESRQR